VQNLHTVSLWATAYKAILVCPVCLSVTLMCCGQTAGCIRIPLGTDYGGRSRPRWHCVRWGPSSPRGTGTQFSAHVCCGQTAGWIKMPLGMDVGLSPGHIVLDGDAAPPSRRKGHSPQFSARVCYG